MANIDVNQISARVASMEPSHGDASVILQKSEITGKPEFVFSFKIPAGENGEDGKNIIGVVLTNENEWVPCLDDGTPDPDLKQHASTRILLKEGDTIIEDGVSYYIQTGDVPGEFTVDQYGDVNVTLTKDSPENVDIICEAVYNGVTHTKIFSVKKAIGTPVYKIVPDISAFKQIEGQTVAPGELRVDVIKWNGKNGVLANKEKTVYYNFELIAPDPTTGITGETKKTAEYFDYDSDTRTGFITLSNYSNGKSLELFIENEDGVIVDSQSVAILKDGIGVITAYAFTTVPSHMDLSDYTVTGGYYSTITDSNTYRSFKTIHSYSGEDLSATIEGKPTNANDHSDNEAVWMISQVFTSVDDSQEEEHTGSHPIRLADSDIFQVEYSSGENSSNVDEIIAPVSLEGIKNRAIQNGVDEKTLDSETLETLGRDYEESEGRIWGDDVENPKGMATAHFRNGRGTDGTVAKVRGDIGYNALKLELSNDSEFIPAIEEGGVGVPDPDLTPIASTFVELHDGHEAKIQSCQIKIECSDASLGTMTDFSTSGPTEEIVMTNESDEVTWKFTKEAELIVYKMSKDMMFTITAEYVNPRHSQPSQYSNSFKLRFAKNAIVYKIVPNVNVIKINSEGTAYPDNLAITVRKGDGAKGVDVALEEGQTILKYEADVDFPVGVNVSYVNGQLVIPIENSAGGQQWPTEFNFETEIVTEDSKVLIGKETETVPVMWDGKHISTVDEYYCIVPDLVTPSVPSRNYIDSNPNQTTYVVEDVTGTLVKEGESIPVATATEPCLGNMELIYDSYGDCVIEPSAALVGRRGLDGLTPYKTFEFYATSSDILISPEKENYTLKETGVDLPRPDGEHPYLGNFERVLYNKEGYTFSDEDIAIIKSPNFSESSLSDNGKLSIQDKFLRIDDTPEAIIGTIGAGSVYSNIYKRFAKGKSQKTADDIVVPAPECGSYKCPAPGYIGEPDGGDGLNGSDGIPARGIVYDFDGNLIENYNEREHGGALLYISTRIFTQDGDSPATATGKPAAPAVDGNGVDYEWCSLFLSKEEVGTPTTKPDNGTNVPSEQAVGMAVRTMGFDGAWTEWTVTTIMGEPGVHLELTNEHVMIPTTDDGATLLGDWDESGDDGIELAVTYAKVFNGSSEVKDLNIDNFATTLTFKGYVEGKGYEFLLESASTNISTLNDSNEYNISVNYKGVHTKTLTVVKAKGSPVYRLVPSASEFIKDVNTNVMTPASITFTVSKGNGQEGVEIANTSNSDASEKLAAENVSLTTLSLDNEGDVMLKSSNGIILDREYIGCVTTGKNGINAQHAGHIELSNDYEMVFTDADGNLTSHSIMPSSTATFYYGDSQPSVTFDCTTISGQWEINENTVTLSSFSENSDEAVIEFVCQYAKVTYRKRFTVKKSRGNAIGSLIITPSNINLNASGDLKEQIVCSAKCIKTETIDYVTGNTDTCILKKNGEVVNNGVFTDKNPFELELYIKNSDGSEMLADKESVGVVIDGNSKFKATAFMRLNSTTTPDTPEGGSYASPKPTTFGGSEGIPEGQAQLGASTRIFSLNGKEDTNGSVPQAMTDTETFDVEYSTSDVDNPGTPEAPLNNAIWSNDATTNAIGMATRTISNGVANNGSVSKIKGEKGDEGEAKFKSIVFKKSTQPSVSAPSGGSYESPVPTGWDDGVPADGTGAVWMSSCTFVKGDTSTPVWSTPKIMADSAEFDVEYSSLENPSAPSGHPNTTEGWSNTPNDPIWMATSNCKNGVWTDWTISRVKGEKGDPGAAGGSGAPGVSKFRSTVFVRSNVTPTGVPTGGSYDSPKPTSTHDGKTWSDSIPNGTSILWASNRTFSSDGSEDDATWSTPVQMTDTASLDVEYSTVAENPGNPTDNSSNWSNIPSSSAIWMATRTCSNGTWSNWTVSKIKGEKGETGGRGPIGKGIKTITKKYQRHNIATEAPTGTGGTTMPTLTDDYLYMGCQETITYNDDTSDPPFTYVCAVKGATGAAGQPGGTGKQGPVLYAAGIGNKYDGYELSDTRVPYVYLAGETDKTKCYWQLIKDVDASATGANKSPKEDSEHWKAMEYFESVYADAGAFNQALVGAFVFHGDNMYSQYFNGKDNDAYSSHASATIGSDGHVPNAGINAKNGSAGFSNGKAKFNKDGTGHLGDSSKYIKYDGNGKVTLSGITISYDQIDDDAKNSLKSDAQSGMVSDSDFGTKFANQVESKKLVDATQVETTITNKGYQTADNVNTIINGKGYQTATQVENTITNKGYQTATQVQKFVDGKGFQTADNVNAIVDGKGYQTADNVNTIINGKGFQTADNVNTIINGKGYQTATQVNNIIASKKLLLQEDFNKYKANISDQLKNYVTSTDVNTAIVNKTSGFVTSSNLTSTLEAYAQTSAISGIVAGLGYKTEAEFKKFLTDNIMTYVTKEKLITQINDTSVATGTVIANDMLASDIIGKNITGSKFVSDSDVAEGHITIEDGKGLVFQAPDFYVEMGAGCSGIGIRIGSGDAGSDPTCPNSAITIRQVPMGDYSIRAESKIASTGFYQTSDKRLKDVIKNIDVDLDVLKTIPKVYFKWKDRPDVIDIGTLAQDLQPIFPEIAYQETNGRFSVDYSKLSIIALAAIDKLHEENSALKTELERLKQFVYDN